MAGNGNAVRLEMIIDEITNSFIVKRAARVGTSRFTGGTDSMLSKK